MSDAFQDLVDFSPSNFVKHELSTTEKFPSYEEIFILLICLNIPLDSNKLSISQKEIDQHLVSLLSSQIIAVSV